jgi:hypothetical protein
MSKSKLPAINGSGVTESLKGLIDYVKYRKYAKEGYTTVIEINDNNNMVRIRDGIHKDNRLFVKGTDASYLVDKLYVLPTKKLVTKCAIVSEGAPMTLDIKVPYNAKQAKILLHKFANVKLLEEFNTFNMGQVIIGLFAGIILGALGFIILQLVGGVMVG